MATMNVSLPDPMKNWVEEQTQNGKYGNASDYVRDLIRKDQDRKEKMLQFQKLLDEGMKSGVSSRTMEDILKEAQKLAEQGE